MKKLILTITGVAALLLAGLGTYRAFSGPSRADTTFSKSDALEKAGQLEKENFPVLSKLAGELEKENFPVLGKGTGELGKPNDLGVLFGG